MLGIIGSKKVSLQCRICGTVGVIIKVDFNHTLLMLFSKVHMIPSLRRCLTSVLGSKKIHVLELSGDSRREGFLSAATDVLCARFVRRGRADLRRRGRQEETEDELSDRDQEISSDIENLDELAEWIEKPDAPILVASSRKVRKYLPPGNLAELFQHYRAAQTLLGRSGVGSPCSTTYKPEHMKVRYTGQSLCFSE